MNQKMPHSFVNIWIHAVWATKYREPMICDDFEDKLYTFIYFQLKSMGCAVRIVNGMPDHVHCLFSLSRQLSIAAVLKQVKGASSRFVNANKFTPQNFKWQNGYSVFSVSPKDTDRVYKYIKFQKWHHRNIDYENELERFSIFT